MIHDFDEFKAHPLKESTRLSGGGNADGLDTRLGSDPFESSG